MASRWTAISILQSSIKTGWVGKNRKADAQFQFYKVRLKRSLRWMERTQGHISILQSSIKTKKYTTCLTESLYHFNSTKFD